MGNSATPELLLVRRPCVRTEFFAYVRVVCLQTVQTDFFEDQASLDGMIVHTCEVSEVAGTGWL